MTFLKARKVKYQNIVIKIQEYITIIHQISRAINFKPHLHFMCH